jgi:hypothetical protein
MRALRKGQLPRFMSEGMLGMQLLRAGPGQKVMAGPSTIGCRQSGSASIPFRNASKQKYVVPI